jgi:serine/threonine protein kinase
MPFVEARTAACHATRYAQAICSRGARTVRFNSSRSVAAQNGTSASLLSDNTNKLCTTVTLLDRFVCRPRSKHRSFSSHRETMFSTRASNQTHTSSLLSSSIGLPMLDSSTMPGTIQPDNDIAALHTHQQRADAAEKIALCGSLQSALSRLKDEKQQLADRYLVITDKARRLGQGRHGIVRPAIHRYSGRDVAVKSIDKFQNNWYLNEEDLLHEVRTLDRLQGHPNIMELIEVFDAPINLHLVTEMCCGGDLFGYLDSVDFEPLPAHQVRAIARQLLSAVSFCHAVGVVHLDIKPENVMIRAPKKSPTDATSVSPSSSVADRWSHDDLVLVDFGHCRLSSDGAKHGQDLQDLPRMVGSPSYGSPEVILDSKFSELSDAYSVGVILYVAMTGCLPYPHLQSTCVEDFRLSHYQEVDPFSDPDDWAMFPPEALETVRGLMSVAHNSRMSVEEALAGPWLRLGASSMEPSIMTHYARREFMCPGVQQPPASSAWGVPVHRSSSNVSTSLRTGRRSRRLLPANAWSTVNRKKEDKRVAVAALSGSSSPFGFGAISART